MGKLRLIKGKLKRATETGCCTQNFLLPCGFQLRVCLTMRDVGLQSLITLGAFGESLPLPAFGPYAVTGFVC